jgi:hypothetical protein
MLLGKWEVAFGVAGRTLIDACGDLDSETFADDTVGVETVSMLLEDIDDALEWECA